MFALLAFAGVRAQSDDSTDPSYWDEDKLAEYDASVTGSYTDVIYMKSSIFPAGSGVVELPIYVKAHDNFMNVQFRTVLPEGLYPQDANDYVTLVYNEDRIKDADGRNFPDYGYTQYINQKSWFSSKEDDWFFSIKVDISSLEVGVYDLVVKSGAKVSGYENSFNGSTLIPEDIVTKLVISNEVILNENDTDYPDTYAGVNVKVIRSISANNWNTLCLPFDMSKEQCEEVFGNDVELAEFDGYEILFEGTEKETLNMKFKEITSITNNRPCIIKISQAISEFKVKGVNITPADDIEDVYVGTDDAYMQGTYTKDTELVTWKKQGKKDVVDIQYIFLSGNKFWFATESTQKMLGFRAYFYIDVAQDYKDALAGAKMIFNVEGEPTSIDGISSIEKVADGVYNVSGQKVSESSLEGLPKGVYIVNGKKVFKK